MVTRVLDRVVPGVSPGIWWAAHLVPLCVLPSAVWRVVNPVSVECRGPMGAWEPVYVVGLSVVSLGAALLTLGLVRPWGEVVPRWIPVLGGRNVPVRAATTVAGSGTAVIFLLYGFLFLNPIFEWRAPPNDPACPPPVETSGAWVAILSYAPLLLWGPLLLLVTVAYYRRRHQVHQGM